MTIELDHEIERLVAEHLESGRYGDAAEVIHSALRALGEQEEKYGGRMPSKRTDRVHGLDTFFQEIDSDPPADAPPLSDEALRREHLYPDRGPQA